MAVMKCSFCLDIKAKNVFTEGCTDFQRSTLTRHASSDAHRRAIEIRKSKGSILKSFQRAEESASFSLSKLKIPKDSMRVRWDSVFL